jgi:hypothetical protein
MLELLTAIVALQYITAVQPARVGAVWLEGRRTPAAAPGQTEALDYTRNA